jgi:hypothetical protein
MLSPLAALCLTLAAASGADPVPHPESFPPLSALAPDVRLHFIDGHLRSEAHRARLWSFGWGGGYGALTVGQAVPAFLVEDRGLRIDLVVGAVSSLFGVALILFVPLEVMADSDLLAGRLSQLPPGADPAPLLADAERLFAAAAEDEAFGVSLWLHAGNVAFNVLIGLVLGLGFGRWESGAISTGIGIAVGEAMILTQPDRLRGLLARYRSGQLDAEGSPAVSWRLAPLAFPSGGGLALAASF